MIDNEAYAIYLRKSRSDMELEKYNKKLDTLDRHMKILNNLCITENYNVTKVYKEVVSGETINERKEMQELIKDVRNNKYRGVLVVEISRLSRGDKIDQGRIAKIFKYTNTLVITPDKVYDLSNEKDEEAFEDELTNSGKELKTIKKRLNRGKRSSILEGKFVGSIPPYGYKKIKIENDKGFTLTENIEEAIIVRKIFEMFVTDDIGYNKIASKLNTLGVIPRKGEYWSSSSIKDIIRNPVYIGKIRWNYRPEKKYLKEEDISVSRPRNNKPLIINGIHTSIVEENIWNLAQTKINSKVIPVQRDNSIKNPLAHILICKKCGRYMQRRPYNKTGYDDVIQCIHPNCNNISSKLKLIEQVLTKALKYWLTEYKINIKNVLQKGKLNKRQQNINKINTTETAINKEKNRLKLINESYEDGTYDKTTYKERYKITTNKIRLLENELKQITQPNKDINPKIRTKRCSGALKCSILRMKKQENVKLNKIKDKTNIKYHIKKDKNTKQLQTDNKTNVTKTLENTTKTTSKHQSKNAKHKIYIKSCSGALKCSKIKTKNKKNIKFNKNKAKTAVKYIGIKDKNIKTPQIDNKTNSTKITDNTIKIVKTTKTEKLKNEILIKNGKYAKFDVKNNIKKDKTTKQLQQDNKNNISKVFENTRETTVNDQNKNTKLKNCIEHRSGELQFSIIKYKPSTKHYNQNAKHKYCSGALEYSIITKSKTKSDISVTPKTYCSGALECSTKNNKTNDKKELNLMDIYNCLKNPAEKNRLLRAIVSKIEYEKEKGSKITLIIHPKIPRQT